MNQFRLGHPAFSPQLFLAPMGLELRQDSRHASARAISNLGDADRTRLSGYGKSRGLGRLKCGESGPSFLMSLYNFDVCQTLCLLNLPESRHNNGDLGREDHA
jgi:hypothetical protein